MAKYKVKGTDILHDGKLYPEGSIISPDEKSVKQLADYLELIPEETKKSSSKTQTKPTQTLTITPVLNKQEKSPSDSTGADDYQITEEEK